MKKNIPYLANKNFTYKPIVYWYFIVVFVAIILRFFILNKESFGQLTILTLALI